MGKPHSTFHVASWNILIDDNPNTLALPQHQRCDSLSDTLEEIGHPLDFLGLYEVEGTAEKNCGMDIGKKLGMEHVKWAQHFRPQEGIMLVAREPIRNIRTVTLDPDQGERVAIIAEQASIAIVALHLISFVTKPNWRLKEITKLLEELENYRNVIILGDFNCLPTHKPRKLLESSGFTSVMGKLSPERSSTFPTGSYREISMKPWQSKLVPKGLSIDDIYFKNLELQDGGLFEGDTDHHGLWASLKIV